MSKVFTPPPRATILASLRQAWGVRGDLGWALDILRHGVCGDCSLGTHGWRDEFLRGRSICPSRLEGLERWTAGPIPSSAFEDVPTLATKGQRELRSLGRLSEPRLWRCDQSQMTSLSWDDALKLASGRIAASGGNWRASFNPSEMSNEAMFCLTELASSCAAKGVVSPLSSVQEESSVTLTDLFGSDGATRSLKALRQAEVVLLFACSLDAEPLLGEYLRLAQRAGVDVIDVSETEAPLKHEGREVVCLVGPQISSEEEKDTLKRLRQLCEAASGADGPIGFIPVGWPRGYRGASDLGLTRLGDTGDFDAEQEGSVWLQVGASSGPGGLSGTFRIHQIHDLDPSIFHAAPEAVLLLPMQSRFEMVGGGTYTSLVGQVRFSPEIRGHQIGSAKPDWWPLTQLRSRLESGFEPWDDGDEVRRRLSESCPLYAEVSELFRAGDGFDPQASSSATQVSEERSEL